MPCRTPLARAAVTLAVLVAGGCGEAPADPLELGSTATSAEIQAARDAADGTGLALPVHGAFVTYVRPAVGADEAGFFLQSQVAGPALFVAVDPAGLSPVPVRGDQVDLTITAMETVAGRRQASALTGWSVIATGVAVATLQKDLTSAADLVSGLGGYESELARVTGELRTDFSGAGSGFVAAGLDTAAVTNDPLLAVRLPTVLRDELDLALGCTVRVSYTPLWRNESTVQVTAWSADDLTVIDCPAPRVVSAVAASETSVVVTFDRDLDPASVLATGAQFTFDGGLAATAAAAGVREVTVTTTTQAGAATYTVTVAGTVRDRLGTPVDPAFDQATFRGFVTPATLILNEVNASVAAGADLIELRALTSGSTRDILLEVGVATPNVLATLADVEVAAGDLIVVHLSPPAGVVTETTAKDGCGDPLCYPGAWDVAGTAANLADTTRILVVESARGVLTDAVPFTDGETTGLGSTFLGDLAELQFLSLWLPANCDGDPCTLATTPTALEISVGWTGMGTTATGSSVRRIAASDTDLSADWEVGPSSFGATN